MNKIWIFTVGLTSFLALACGPGNTGTIDISSTPTGASVYLDDSLTSYTTNCVIEDVEAGEHTVRLQLAGYVSYVDSFTLEAGETYTISATLLEVAQGEELWAFSCGQMVRGAPAIGDDGTIYAGSWDGFLYAINPDGAQKWSFDAGDFIQSAPAIGDDGTIYFGCYDNKVYALNPNGSEKWSFPTSSNVHASPAIGSNGKVYVAVRMRRLVTQELVDCVIAINPGDGSEFARYEITEEGDLMESSPAIGSDGSVYVCANDNRLYALTPDLTLKWSTDPTGFAKSSPTVDAQGNVYVGSTDFSLYAFDDQGSLLWSFATGHEVVGSAVFGTDGNLYFGSNDGNLYALSASGNLLWSNKVGFAIRSTPAVGVDGIIYVGAVFGDFVALNSDGTESWTFKASGTIESCPAIASDGTIYFGSDDGKLYAIAGTSAGLASSSWPRLRHDNRNSGSTQ